ncbi:hypothetical protein [Novosphingobium sp.]|uniref:hypothetical protein n=1 Tax=Novosphingobium sp. TaxID=1874826 RepID=UPI002736392B|nr:hypothetical protein [Novosphingobium sp.]MDP3908471.1 hypothetical protein [Novosphingobium sp.]
MSSEFNDLHDYTLAAWSVDHASWTMVFDIYQPEQSVHQTFEGVRNWYVNAVRSPVGVLELRAWEINPTLLDDHMALQSWTRLFGYECSSDKIRAYAIPIIEENLGNQLVMIETVDGGTVDLICERLGQRSL